MKVFLTGATGFIGQALTRQLIEKNWEVIAFTRHPDDRHADAVRTLGATVVGGNILDVESTRDAMRGVDLVIHNAGAYEYGVTGDDKTRMYDVNVTGTDNVLGLALELDIPRTVYVSSTVIYGEMGTEPIDESFESVQAFPTHYAMTKTKAHDVALEYIEKGLPLVIACPNGVVGPNDHSGFGYFLRMYLNNLMTPFAWDPNTLYAAVHVDDLADGLVRVAEKGRIGETYILSGEIHSRRDLLDIWATKPGGFKVRRLLAKTHCNYHVLTDGPDAAFIWVARLHLMGNHKRR